MPNHTSVQSFADAAVDRSSSTVLLPKVEDQKVTSNCKRRKCNTRGKVRRAASGGFEDPEISTASSPDPFHGEPFPDALIDASEFRLSSVKTHWG